MKDLEILLELDGLIIEQKMNCWVKFEIRQASAITTTIPHGIRYSLSLHDRYGKRLMGFDNAHAITMKKTKKHRAVKTYDHRHRHAKDKGIPYEFIDAYQLLNDFWQEVDHILDILEQEM